MRGIFVWIGGLLGLCLAATRPGFTHDDKTTYCWRSDQSVFASNPPEDTITAQGVNDQCPIKIVAEVLTKNIEVRKPVRIRWTVSYDFSQSSSNEMGITQLYTAVDPEDRESYEIIHSNLHSCEFGTLCDPFNDGRKALSPTVNQAANFDGNSYTFESDEMVFSTPGVYSILSHVILPGENPDTTRYDYVAYTRLTTQDDDDGGSSSNAGVIIGVIAGILVAAGIVGIIIALKKRSRRGQQQLVTTPHYDEDMESGGVWKDYAARDNSTTYHGQVERKTQNPTAPEDSPLRSLYVEGSGHHNYDGGQAYFPSLESSPRSRTRDDEIEI